MRSRASGGLIAPGISSIVLELVLDVFGGEPLAAPGRCKQAPPGAFQFQLQRSKIEDEDEDD